MERVFLGWDRPLLPAAADYLIERFAKDGHLDMRRAVLALPGRRAVNRLEEILAEQVERFSARNQLQPDWYPPTFLTLGTLPEQFYELGKPIADDLTQRFAWVEVVDRLYEENSDLLRYLLPAPPRSTDLEARLALGKMFATLHRELAADALDFIEVKKYCDGLRIRDESQRWAALAKLQEFYHNLLDSLGVWDLQSARLFAIRHQQPDEYQRIHKTLKSEDKHFFLLGLVDMNRAQKDILHKFSEFVTSLVFAPETLAGRFDAFGCLDAEAWGDIEIPVDDDQIEVVDRPEHQANNVLRTMAGFDGRYAAEEIVIGVPDPQVIPFIEQRLDQAELVSRHFEGTPMKRTAVYRFLEVTLAFLESRDFRSLAELVRHPDVEDFLRADPAVAATKTDGDTEPFVDLLSELDRYHGEFLPDAVGDSWKEIVDEDNSWRNHSFDALKRLWHRLKELLDIDIPSTERCGSNELPSFWTKKIKAILDRLYDGKDDHLTVEALKQVRAAGEALAGIPSSLAPRPTLFETIRLILLQLESGNIPPHEKPHAVELIGWLEIVMDDAPVAIITGMNDGFVPSFLTSDLFLPDKVRSHLGIEDNRRRFARDAYSLSVILASRQSGDVRLIGGRRSTDGDPMLPSRLFFAADDETVARRVSRFFGPMRKEPALILAGTVQPGCETKSDFQVPAPLPLETLPGGVPKAMRVTEFGEYLQCPYRYYLKNRLKLDVLRDDGEELDARAFGTLVHEILKEFGRSPLKDSGSAEAIRESVHHSLLQYTTEKYGDKPRPAIAIQIERALARLEAFADWQARRRAEGHKIIETEFAFDDLGSGRKIFLEVDGKPILLRGRIDRIDAAPDGRLTVLDYKTSDSAAEPDTRHRKKNPEGERVWVDFQLPLYHYILRQAGYPQAIELGYVTLPKDLGKTDIQLAPWSEFEIDDAVEQARDIVRRIRRNEFEKVDPPPRFSENFAAICLDNVLR